MLLPLLQVNGNTHACVEDLVTNTTSQLLHRDLYLSCVSVQGTPNVS